jgi:transcriptional regulator with XRE-family HTH domain
MSEPSPSPFLRAWMRSRGQKPDPVADAIGMSRPAFRRRLRGDQPFHLPQAQAICQFLGQDYSTLFPGHSGIDPRDLEAVKHAALVGSDLAGVA